MNYSNSYPANCLMCGRLVPSKHGRLVKKQNQWVVICMGCHDKQKTDPVYHSKLIKKLNQPKEAYHGTKSNQHRSIKE